MLGPKDINEPLVSKAESLSKQEIERQKNIEKLKKHNASGIWYTIGSGILKCLGLIFGKLLYNRNPEMTPNQLIVYRALFSSVALILYINKDLLKVMTVRREDWCSLLLRAVQGNITVFITFTSVKHFSLATVSIVQNISPLLTALAGVLFLKETMTKNQWIKLFVTFGCILCLILGANA